MQTALPLSIYGEWTGMAPRH